MRNRCTLCFGMRVKAFVLWTPLVASLAGCPTVDLGTTPEDVGLCNPAMGEAYFESQIWPNYINNTTKPCVTSGCHDPAGQSALRFTIATPVDYTTNYKATQIYLSCSDPSSSEMLTKPTGGEAHGGGVIFTSGDPNITLFLNWFSP